MTVRRGSLHDDHDWEYMQYFLSRPMEESFDAMEKLRKAMHGEDYETKLRLRELLLLLNDESVDYLLIGAYALAAHGMPRYTGDIDLFYRASEENVERMLQVLNALGFESPDLNMESLMQPDSVFYFGHPPFRIDLLNTISGVSFETAWESAVRVVVDEVPLSVLSLQHLAINKKSTGRTKDAADLELIEKRLAEGERAAHRFCAPPYSRSIGSTSIINCTWLLPLTA